MMGLGDRIVFLSAIIALGYGVFAVGFQRTALYFKLIVGAIFCHFLGFLFDICEYYTSGTLSEGFTISYLGSIGCFLFLLTANFAYLDGVIDDRTPAMKKSRFFALLAPLCVILILVLNFFADVPLDTKICYAVLFFPAIFSSYYNLKHAIIPDMGFGFVKAIRPFNMIAFTFTILQLVHLTLWNFCGWLPLLVSGILLSVSSILMMILARRGVKKWTL